MAIPAKTRCSVNVYPTGGWHAYPCTRMATRVRNGKYYCWQHDPVTIEEKQKKKKRAEVRADQNKNDALKREADRIIKLLGFGSRVYSSYSPVRVRDRISITFSEAEKIAERLGK